MLYHILRKRDKPAWLDSLGLAGDVMYLIWLGVSSVYNLLKNRVEAIKIGQLDAWLFVNGIRVGVADCQMHEGKGERYAQCIADEYNSLLND